MVKRRLYLKGLNLSTGNCSAGAGRLRGKGKLQPLGSSRVVTILRPLADEITNDCGQRPDNNCHPAGAERLHKNFVSNINLSNTCGLEPGDCIKEIG
jgi:hypothetical protein